MGEASRGFGAGGIFLLRGLLIAGAVVILIWAAANGIGWLVPGADRSGLASVAELGLTVVLALGLLGLAGVLRLLAGRIRQGQTQQGTLDQIRLGQQEIQVAIRERTVGNVPLVPEAVALPVPPARSRDESEELRELLIEIRDLALMTEAQRAAYARQHWEKKKGEWLKAVDREIDLGQWEAAQARLTEIAAFFPNDAAVAEMRKRIGAEQAQRARQDIEAAKIQLRHLMAVTAWAQAEEIIASLVKRYPEHPEIAALAAEIRHEREVFEHEHYERLMLDLKDAFDHKQWRRAILAAEELIRRYPEDRKVEKLKVDLPTLRENAEAQERRDKEASFRDLLHRQRYEEAHEVAKSVIEKYPASPAAQELGKLLPKVEELIRQEKAKRAGGPETN